MKDRIDKLEAEVEALFNLTLRAHERFLFLRPMLANQELNDRIGKESRAIGFRQLRNWLYWALVQELSKICSDNDKRSPCIAKITEKLKDDRLRRHLEEKSVKRNREMGEARIRAAFTRVYAGYANRAEEMLSSTSVGGYKTIRDKLISHNELRRAESGYDFFDVKHAKLKYGDERKLLETLRALIDDLLHMVRNVDFSWDSFFRQEQRIVCDFWAIDGVDWPVSSP